MKDYGFHNCIDCGKEEQKRGSQHLRCLACATIKQNQQRKEWVKNNPDKIKNWRKDNADGIKNYGENWRKNNKERRRDADRQRHRKNPERQAIARRRWLYKMSEQEFKDKIVKQNNCCAICLNAFFETPHIDHDHKTGKNRDLLCRLCNVILGHSRDSVVVLERAIKYLKKHQQSEKAE